VAKDSEENLKMHKIHADYNNLKKEMETMAKELDAVG
jgi:hypothetical protein